MSFQPLLMLSPSPKTAVPEARFSPSKVFLTHTLTVSTLSRDARPTLMLEMSLPLYIY